VKVYQVLLTYNRWTPAIIVAC